MCLALLQGGGEGTSLALIIALASPVLTFLGLVIAARMGLLSKLLEQKASLTLGLATATTAKETVVIQEIFDRLDKAEAAKDACAEDLTNERRERESEVSGLNADLNAVWMTVELMLMLKPELEQQVEETRRRMETRREAQRLKARLSGEYPIHTTRPPEAGD
jgi:predicted transposase YdaD